MNRRLARYAAAAAHAAGLGPNAVTFASAVASALGIVLILSIPVSPYAGVAIAVLLAFGYLLDSADGQVARLSGRGSLAGEWLDHVVDAIRTPTIHLAVLISLWRSDTVSNVILLVPIVYCVVAVGQFMSQILAEQLARTREPGPGGNGIRQSIVLVPTDTGTLCWIFLAWGSPIVFTVAYGTLFVLNVIHTAVSMRRKYQKLVGLSR